MKTVLGILGLAALFGTLVGMSAALVANGPGAW